jgi:hypothetical protein
MDNREKFSVEKLKENSRISSEKIKIYLLTTDRGFSRMEMY